MICTCLVLSPNEYSLIVPQQGIVCGNIKPLNQNEYHRADVVLVRGHNETVLVKNKYGAVGQVT